MATTGKTGSSKQAWIIGSLVFVASGVALYFLFKEFKKTKFYLQKKLVSIYKNHPTWEVNNQIGSKANPTTQLAGIYKISGKINVNETVRTFFYLTFPKVAALNWCII